MMAQSIEERRAKRREHMRKWRAENPGVAAALARAWREANPERAKANVRAWKEANPNYWREWREANRERQKTTRAAWRAANPDTWRASTRAYREANADRQRQMIREWLAANPGKSAEWSASRRARLQNVVVEKVDRAAIIARDRSICHLCGKRVPKKDIELDHLIPIAEGGSHTAANLAVAHRFCNRSKGTRAANDQLRIVG